MLEKLKEYKELISIIVFFLGGFFWINNQFPTKKDQDAEFSYLQCRLDQYMKLTQLQMHGQEIAREAQELTSKLLSIESSTGGAHLSPAMRLEQNKLKSDFNHNLEKKRNNKEETQAITDEIGRDTCRNGGGQ